MASQAIPSYGTLLKRETSAGSGTFATIAEVKSIDGPGMKANQVDVTTHSSAAAGAWKEMIVTLLDPGDVKFMINLVPGSAGHKSLISDFTSRTKTNFQMIFPDGLSTTWAFAGYIIDFSAKAPTDGVLEANMTITISGAPTFP